MMKRMKTRGMASILKWASLAVAALVSASPALAAEAAPSGDAEARPDVRLPAIIVVEAQERMIADRVIASGVIYPVEEVYVYPEVAGLSIETLDAEVGDRVKAGQVLATLDRNALDLERSRLNANRLQSVAQLEQIEAQISEARANAAEAVRVRDRAAQLAERGIIAGAQRDQTAALADAAAARVTSAEESLNVAKLAVDVIEAQIDDVDLRLSRTDIKSPVSGIIASRNIGVGTIASMGENPMFMIMKDGALEVRVDIPEVDLLKIETGQQVNITVVGLAEPITGKVHLVEPTLDLSTRLGTARISIDDSSLVRSGMFANAEIIVAQREGIVVPLTSVNMSGRVPTVMRVVDNRVAITPVETGIRDNGFVEVLSGLSIGDTIVMKAGAFVRDGDRINPVLREQQGAAALRQ